MTLSYAQRYRLRQLERGIAESRDHLADLNHDYITEQIRQGAEREREARAAAEVQQRRTEAIQEYLRSRMNNRWA